MNALAARDPHAHAKGTTHRGMTVRVGAKVFVGHGKRTNPVPEGMSAHGRIHPNVGEVGQRNRVMDRLRLTYLRIRLAGGSQSLRLRRKRHVAEMVAMDQMASARSGVAQDNVT